MDDKTKNTGKANDPETHSAFARRDKPASSGDTTEVPIPSQPRSFSPVRPQRSAAPRKPLTTPATPAANPAASEAPMAEKPSTNNSNSRPTPADPAKEHKPAAASTPASKPSAAPVPPGAAAASTAPAQSTSSFKARSAVGPTAANAAAAKLDKAAGTGSPAAPAATAVAAGSSVATPPRGTASHPQSSGAGGDTIRLRVSPRSHARTLNTSPGRGIRRRLPDIRQARGAGGSNNYGPFSLFFGFLWLIFKMVFFTALVLGLGAMIGFMVMTEYIKTPEVTVPNVSGMKVDEAFEVLSDKRLGVIKLRTESSALVAPGEIVSQQPPAGATAKVNTDVGVVISSGRSQYVVPDVVGETRENAVNKIRGARLEVGNILPLEDNSVPAGSVISQTPLGGTGSDEPAKVDLMISAGPPGKSLNMPDLTGLTVLEAKAALKAVGIENVVTVPEDAPDTAKVESQLPLVSKTVFQTDKVTLNTEAE